MESNLEIQYDLIWIKLTAVQPTLRTISKE